MISFIFYYMKIVTSYVHTYQSVWSFKIPSWNELITYITEFKWMSANLILHISDWKLTFICVPKKFDFVYYWHVLKRSVVSLINDLKFVSIFKMYAFNSMKQRERFPTDVIKNFRLTVKLGRGVVISKYVLIKLK